MSKCTRGPAQQMMSRREAINSLIAADAKFMDEREDLTAYFNTLEAGKALSEQDIHQGYQAFKAAKKAHELASLAKTYALEPPALQAFVDLIMARMIFDGELLSDLFAPQQLGWKARGEKERALMQELIPLLHKLAQGRDISGLRAYE
jgi:type I restriction enzyme, R subunit